MPSPTTAAITLLSAAFAMPVAAALAIGARAPDFTVAGMQGPTTVTVKLSELLGKGPVVVFFFPSVFTGGSAEECHEFADNIDKFSAAGAAVVGMSRDADDALARFSAQDCAGKISIASADLSLVTGFDVNDNANFATRTTYVVAPSGSIVFVDDDDDYSAHVKKTLSFVQSMKR